MRARLPLWSLLQPRIVCESREGQRTLPVTQTVVKEQGGSLFVEGTHPSKPIFYP